MRVQIRKRWLRASGKILSAQTAVIEIRLRVEAPRLILIFGRRAPG
jgi:hypothetical protein